MHTDVVKVTRPLWSIGNYNLAMLGFVELAILFGCISKTATAFRCYPDYCQSAPTLATMPGFQCVLTKVEKGGDCDSLAFNEVDRAPANADVNKFHLHAYVYEEEDAKATAFNFSVTDANFLGLVTRYQSLLDNAESSCRYIKLYGNETRPAPKELYVSCPFSDDSYESVPYRLDYLATGKNFNYSKRYVFNVPAHKFIEQGTSVKEYRPFVYIDVSHAPLLSLHVQPLPETYNVTKYRIWLVNNDTKSVTFTDIFSTTTKQDIRYNFTAHTGVFYFKVAPIHEDCGGDGCANSTTPFIIIQKTSHRLLIMIISTVWIPPVILYVLYHLYKLYKREVSKGRGTPKCLLVYSPTRSSHVTVALELAKYLRACNINATIDVLDLTDNTEQGIECWCDAAFRSADIVLLVASPPSKKSAESAMYRNTYNHLLKLIKEGQSSRVKRYYIAQLPYCKPDDTPEETCHFRKFCLPKELSKLVKVMDRAEPVRRGRISSVSDKEFLDSVKFAKLEILDDDATNVAKDRETENLLSSESPQVAGKRIFSLDDAAPRSFATNIDDLNLLGKGEQGEEARTLPCLRNDVHLFPIDQLNL